MVFTGTYEHTIDAKNRLAIPSEIRSQIVSNCVGNNGEAIGLYVMLGDGGVLCIYTEQGFEQRASELDNSELDSDELLTYERLLFSLAGRVELDKQGRLRLPERLLAMTNLESEVVLIGVKDHLEIRDRQAWQAHVQEILTNRPGILMNPRRAMRKRLADDQGK